MKAPSLPSAKGASNFRAPAGSCSAADRDQKKEDGQLCTHEVDRP